MRGPRHHHGFTLVELVIVIVLTGIVAVMSSVFIVDPVRAYADQARRSRLTDQADIALRRIAADIRRSIPNSVRVTGTTQLSLYLATAGGRYRAAPDSTNAGANVLDFTTADTAFDVPTGFFGLTGSCCAGQRLVIFNLGTSGADVYADDAVITPAATSISLSGMTVSMNPGHRFAFDSPRQRVFLTSGSVAYVCDLAAGTLSRGGVLVTRDVTSCQFAYSAGSASRHAVVTLRLALSRDGETVSLLRQVQVFNLP